MAQVLLDKPLGARDLKLREQMLTELKALQRHAAPQRIRLGAAAGARASGVVVEVQYFGSFTTVREVPSPCAVRRADGDPFKRSDR